jgi:hypothetical protein
MNIFFAVCWGASYLSMLANFIIWGWRWSEDIGSAQAMPIHVSEFHNMGLAVERGHRQRAGDGLLAAADSGIRGNWVVFGTQYQG